MIYAAATIATGKVISTAPVAATVRRFVAFLQLLKSLLNRHCAASVFESADSMRKAPVASKQETIERYKQKTPYQIGV